MKYTRLHKSTEEETGLLPVKSGQQQQSYETGKVTKLVEAMQRILSIKERQSPNAMGPFSPAQR
ncbi:hypothetical protein ACHQM5_009953 [Ranunculus cassubicifolius]